MRLRSILAAVLAMPLLAVAMPDQPFPSAKLAASHPAAVEFSWTPLRMPNGERIALAGGSYLLAFNEEWGFGPSVYGAAKGNFGGLFTAGFTAQRRWRLSPGTHLAAGLYAGAGGGVSSDQVRFGGGLMLRPEISLRADFGSWYAGAALAQIRFPSGNISGSSLGLVLGRMTGFASFDPVDSGRQGRAAVRTGLGMDEIMLFFGADKPSGSSRNRSGQPSLARMGKAGAELRQYGDIGSWWSLEGAGAAQGGADGYMELLAGVGQDWALFGSSLRIGGQLAAGLGGGGNVDTGNGWLLRAGPSLRWQTPWGATLRVDGGLTRAPSGHFSSNYLRIGLGLPLDGSAAGFDRLGDGGRIVHLNQLFVSVQHLPQLRFKDGSSDPVTHLATLMTRELTPSLYGVAQVGSAAIGHAGAYSFGLFGLGLQTTQNLASTRFGIEALLGAAGGGGVAVGGGAVLQAEAWAAWAFGDSDRLRLRAGLGQWRSLRGASQSSPLLNLSLGYGFGT